MLDRKIRISIISDLRSGLKYREISQLRGVTFGQVKHIVSYYGLAKRKKLSQSQVLEIKGLTISGLMTNDICEKMDINPGQVRHVLKKIGLNRKRGRHAQKISQK